MRGSTIGKQSDATVANINPATIATRSSFVIFTVVVISSFNLTSRLRTGARGAEARHGCPCCRRMPGRRRQQRPRRCGLDGSPVLLRSANGNQILIAVT
jgi:hypothetical protein